MIDLAILGLLTEQELHGYELKKRLGELLSSRASISFGSLYPALARLEAQGCVKAVEQRTTVPSAPMSGSLAGELAAFQARVRESGLVKAGRGKKVYGITDVGRDRLVELLSDPDVSDDRAFTLRVAFARHLDPAARLEVFERRRTELLGRRDDLEAPRHRPPRRRLPRRAARARRRPPRQRPRLARSPDRDRAHPIHAIHGGTLMTEIRLAIAGMGNCASALVQGLSYYKDADPLDRVPGLMHVELGGYHIRDIRLVAAFDVDAEKVGLDASKALFADINNTIKFAEVPHLGVEVLRGPTMDGFGEFYRQVAEESPAEPIDVAQVLRDTKADVLVSYLPVGSEDAQRYYAQACLDAGVAFVNAIPVFIASDPEWAEKFRAAGLPIVGDDIKSQVGATIVHRTLARLFEDRGTTIDHTYQLNFGGNMDFMNMLERKRLKSKKISKTQSVTSQIDQGITDRDVHIGPSDHVPWLDDRKWALIRLEGRNFGDVPLMVELKLEVHDSPNSAGVIIDAVRCAKIGLDRGMGGPLEGPSAYFMKSPGKQYRDEEAHRLVEAYANGEADLK